MHGYPTDTGGEVYVETPTRGHCCYMKLGLPAAPGACSHSIAIICSAADQRGWLPRQAAYPLAWIAKRSRLQVDSAAILSHPVLPRKSVVTCTAASLSGDTQAIGREVQLFHELMASRLPPLGRGRGPCPSYCLLRGRRRADIRGTRFFGGDLCWDICSVTATQKPCL